MADKQLFKGTNFFVFVNSDGQKWKICGKKMGTLVSGYLGTRSKCRNMPVIITLANQKGGVGKSTLSLSLYDHFAAAGRSVVLVDSDPQQSLKTLISRVGRTDVALKAATYPRAIVEACEDFAIVDTPPYLSENLPKWMAVSDFVLIPICPGPMDALAVQDVILILREAQKIRAGIDAGIVLNRVIQGTNFTDQVRELVEGFGVPVLNTQIHNRVEYARGMLHGGAISRDEKAKIEIGSLVGEILTMLK